MTTPNQAASGNGAITLLFHAGRPRRAVPEQHRCLRNAMATPQTRIRSPTSAHHAMKKAIVSLLLIGSLILVSSSCRTPDAERESDISVVKKLPCDTVYGSRYNSKAMVQCVNELRRLGKKRALAALRRHIERNGIRGDPREEEKVLLVCRLLFVNPAGWQPPRLGAPGPEVASDLIEEFPLFPIALEKGVPFLLLEGYRGGGFSSDTGGRCVQLCESFSIITGDLPEVGLKNAAHELIRTKAFRRLYIKPSDADRMADMVLRQAGP